MFRPIGQVSRVRGALDRKASSCEKNAPPDPDDRADDVNVEQDLVHGHLPVARIGRRSRARRGIPDSSRLALGDDARLEIVPAGPEAWAHSRGSSLPAATRNGAGASSGGSRGRTGPTRPPTRTGPTCVRSSTGQAWRPGWSRSTTRQGGRLGRAGAARGLQAARGSTCPQLAGEDVWASTTSSSRRGCGEGASPVRCWTLRLTTLPTTAPRPSRGTRSTRAAPGSRLRRCTRAPRHVPPRRLRGVRAVDLEGGLRDPARGDAPGTLARATSFVPAIGG